MISQPSIGRQLQALRTQLAETVAPAVSSPDAATTLQFVLLTLTELESRVAVERKFMLTEIDSIESAVASITTDPEAPPSLRELESDYHHRVASNTASTELSDRYEQAGQLLSDAIDACFAARIPKFIAMLRDTLFERLEHEAAILGETFDWVAR